MSDPQAEAVDGCVRLRPGLAYRLRAAHTDLIPGSGLRQPLPLGSSCRRPVSSAATVGGRRDRRVDHDSRTLSTRQGGARAGCPLPRGSEVPFGVFGRHVDRPRPAHFPRRDRPPTHVDERQRQLVPAAGLACGGCRWPHRLARGALPRCPYQPQLAPNAGHRRAGTARTPPSHRRGRGGAGAELPGVPSDAQPGRSFPGDTRPIDRADGMRRGHRRPVALSGTPGRRPRATCRRR